MSGKYDRRWNSTRAQLLRTRSLGGEFVLLVHDLWGADGYPISRFPGDNGNWADYDNFLTRLIDDVRATGVPVQWDLWNEPNITLFWNRPQSQYFELWRRTYQRIRAAFPGQPIVGPSCACTWNFTPVSGSTGTYTAVNQQSGKCLDATGSSTADGATVAQNTCSPGSASQQYTLRKVTHSGNDPHDHQLVARHSGKCVDVNGVSAAAGARIIQWACKPSGQSGELNQTWRLWGSS